jgi:hypothetical protein
MDLVHQAVNFLLHFIFFLSEALDTPFIFLSVFKPFLNQLEGLLGRVHNNSVWV